MKIFGAWDFQDIKSLLIKSQVFFEKYFKLIFGHNTKTA